MMRIERRKSADGERRKSADGSEGFSVKVSGGKRRDEFLKLETFDVISTTHLPIGQHLITVSFLLSLQLLAFVHYLIFVLDS